MIRLFRLLSVLGMAATVAACSDSDNPIDPSPTDNDGPIVAMTRNMYIGGDVDRVIAALAGASDEDPQAALTAVLQQFIATDLPTRISAMADEIARERPLVVGLQEVSTLSVNLPPEYGVPVINANFLDGLMQALALRGLSYNTVSNLNFSFSLFSGAIGIEDRDVLLVNSALPLTSQEHAIYSCPPLCIPVDQLGTLQRGWVRVTTKIGSRTVTFVSTHPESGDLPQISVLRAGQMQELLGTLAPIGGAVVLLGDLNDTPGSPMYQVLAGGGFVDVWGSTSSDPGYTCCHAPELQGGSFSKRIDYVMVRGGFLTGNGTVVAGTRIRVIGEAAAEKVPGAYGPIWPSDHGGVVVSLPAK